VDTLERLIEKFPVFDPAWPDDLKLKWWKIYGRLERAALTEIPVKPLASAMGI